MDVRRSFSFLSDILLYSSISLAPNQIFIKFRHRV
ncbi:unnamed protein product [Acanthoscelides obtectus]|uniref:Uncharacterized protein n=1 Tax=Acanthoscelides obtectus TaxID=200917 RepID=A0A9P0Q4I7_ACAOB|nr:unnamed protein product [Acanthoscelides obtectus]CAK1626015.1 hypothetical protein AOBTE_LOCUS3549 [Acanthoscelides obtectus]